MFCPPSFFIRPCFFPTPITFFCAFDPPLLNLSASGLLGCASPILLKTSFIPPSILPSPCLTIWSPTNAGADNTCSRLAFLFILGISIFSYFIFDHVQSRINSFLGGLGGTDTYQIDLSIQAFKNGGLLGKGPGQGILKEKIPDANTDFIFAVAGEELGFIFCLIIIFIILSIIIRSLLKVLQLEDPYKIIAISGLICSFGLQCLINIFSSLGLIPTKGMTLPFVSYGGSSMISIAILFGFLLSLTNKKNEEL